MKFGAVILKDGLDANCSNGIPWIKEIFDDCVDTPIKLISFYTGLLSLALWLCVIYPQLVQNYKRKKCDGLSLGFLLFWLIGDMFNVVGSFLSNQQPVQKIIGVYYIVQDCAIWSQYFYYGYIYQRRSRRGSNAVIASCLLMAVAFFGFSFGSPSVASQSSYNTGRRLLSVEGNDLHKPMYWIFDSYSDAIGYVIGSIAAVCYLMARIPQIIKNYRRKSCEGISILMLYAIAAANFTYGLSVLLATSNWLYLARHFPWLIGSLGCNIFDVIGISQYYYYGRVKNGQETEEERLIVNENNDEH